MSTEQLLTEREFCRIFGISRVTSWRLRRQGNLPHLKLAQGIRYTPEHVAAFIASHEISPQAKAETVKEST